MTTVVPLGPSHLGAWGKLFEAAGSACFCHYWHFAGTKNDWLERCAVEPDANRLAQSAAIAEQLPMAQGLIALDSASPASAAYGWMKVSPRDTLPKLRSLSVYRARGLEPDPTVYSVGCVLVHPAHRRSGVARALLSSAGTYARECGALVLEAYPRRASAPLHDEEAWMGPYQMFLAEGFEIAHDEGPYPVLRRTL